MFMVQGSVWAVWGFEFWHLHLKKETSFIGFGMFLPMPLLRTHPQLPPLHFSLLSPGLLLTPGLNLKWSLIKKQVQIEAWLTATSFTAHQEVNTFLYLLVSHMVQGFVLRA